MAWNCTAYQEQAFNNVYRTGSSDLCSYKKNNSEFSQEEQVPMPVQEVCGKTEKLEDVWERRRKKAADASTDWVFTLLQTCCCHILKRRVRRICTHVAHLKDLWEWLSILRNSDREIWLPNAYKVTLDIQLRVNLFHQM